MKIELIQTEADDKETLRNLLEKYEYEFSQWTLQDVNKFGLYGYDYLDCYWTQKNRWAFLIKVDGMLAGFAMVNDFPEAPDETADYTLSEFLSCLSTGIRVWEKPLLTWCLTSFAGDGS